MKPIRTLPTLALAVGMLVTTVAADPNPAQLRVLTSPTPTNITIAPVAPQDARQFPIRIGRVVTNEYAMRYDVKDPNLYTIQVVRPEGALVQAPNLYYAPLAPGQEQPPLILPQPTGGRLKLRITPVPAAPAK